MTLASDRDYRELRERLFAATGGRCWYCGVIPKTDNQRQVDHVIPRGFPGSSNDESNLVACCARCNGAKGGSTVEEFRLWLSRWVAGWPGFSAAQQAWFERAGVVLPALKLVRFFGEDIASDHIGTPTGPPRHTSAHPPAHSPDHVRTL